MFMTLIPQRCDLQHIAFSTPGKLKAIAYLSV